MDVYIYLLDLTEETPQIEIIQGQAVKQFNIGNYVEYNIERSFGPNDKETIMYGFSNKELNIPFFSTNKKCVFLVATEKSNEIDDIDAIFKFCNAECTKSIKRANRFIDGMETLHNYVNEILHGIEQERRTDD